MDAKNRSTRLSAMVIAIGVLAVIWIVWPTSHEVSAEEYLDEFVAYGVANVSPGQIARLHVVTVGIPDVQPAELVIYDGQGNTLARSVARLLPGRAVALDLRFDEQRTTAVVGNRLEFYAAVRFARQRGSSQGYVIPSLEIIDEATGNTIHMLIDPIA